MDEALDDKTGFVAFVSQAEENLISEHSSSRKRSWDDSSNQDCMYCWTSCIVACSNFLDNLLAPTIEISLHSRCIPLLVVVSFGDS